MRNSITSGQELVEFKKKPPTEVQHSSSPLHNQIRATPNPDDFVSINVVNNEFEDMHVMNELDEHEDSELILQIMQMDLLSMEE